LFASVVEPRRYSFRRHAGIGRRTDAGFNEAFESAAFKWANKFVQSLPEDIRDTARATAVEESRKLIALLNELQERQAILETKVTLGLILGEVLHEGRGPVAFLEDESRRLKRWWPIIFSSKPDAKSHRDQAPAILRGMEESSHKLSTLFSIIQPLAGGKRGKPRLYNPLQVVVDTRRLFMSKLDSFGIKFSIKDNPSLRDVVGYRDDLSTAIMNLVDNSVFWLDHHVVKNPEISVHLTSRDGNCVIDFRDNGVGIPEEFQDNVFSVGFSLKPNGTGLGLSIAREAIRRSDGTMELIPSETGVHFSIQVPEGSAG